ncbi:MAG: Na+/H+ antiporter subunit D [Actinomycetota bacterium]|nr:Na+/H+ antiporter subunit D [Actinomycetota bacterium]
MKTLLPLPLLLPILGAAVSILGGRSRAFQRIIGITVLSACTGVSIAILVLVDRDGPAAVQGGDWPAPLGITLVADRLTGIMLTVAFAMLLAVLVFAIGQPGAERGHVGFQSVYLVLAAGVAGAFLAGDLFNLFVSFEMMLTASYVLMTLGGTRAQVRSGMTYVVISLISSALFVTAIALIYTATGTVNLADLSGAMAELPDGLQSGFAVLLIVVFGIKAALFPLFFWLPDSYPTAPSPVTAIFAGLLTKVGVYALIRSQTLLIPEGSRPGTLLLWLAGLTMVTGVLGAIAQDDVKRILSFNIVSHIGFMVMGLGFFTVAGLAAAILYAVHHIVAKTAMFLTGGLIEHVAGSSRLSQLGDLVRRAPLVAWLFVIPALSLAGIPPLSGFVPKVGLVDAGLGDHHGLIVGVSLAVSLLSLYSMLKIWSGAFWNRTPADHTDATVAAPILMVLPTALVATLSLSIAVAAGPLYRLSTRAATDLMDPTAYLQAVLG